LTGPPLRFFEVFRSDFLDGTEAELRLRGVAFSRAEVQEFAGI
jgi:hypothetical protein